MMLEKLIPLLIEEYGIEAIQEELTKQDLGGQCLADKILKLAPRSRINQVKACRNITGWSLKESKDWCDIYIRAERMKE